METKEHAPGTFCWIDLMTTDADGAKKFYTSLFGWEAVDMPVGSGMTYTFLQLKGKEVAALSQMPPDMQKSGLPPVWQSYVSVKSASDAQKRAEAAGAKAIAPAFDVLDAGRMSVLQDPTGAMFSTWEAKKHHGSALAGEPGSLAWTELLTRDTAAAEKFYSTVFGWAAEKSDMGPMGTYTVFKIGDAMIAGMMNMPKEAGQAPPHWAVYFAVEDCDATAEKAKSLGATVHVPPTDIPNVGRFAVLQDPQGGVFNVIKMTM